MKIRIYMKNGTVLPDLECEEFTVQKNNLTGEITGYSFKGGRVPAPSVPRFIRSAYNLEDER